MLYFATRIADAVTDAASLSTTSKSQQLYWRLTLKNMISFQMGQERCSSATSSSLSFPPMGKLRQTTKQITTMGGKRGKSGPSRCTGTSSSCDGRR